MTDYITAEEMERITRRAHQLRADMLREGVRRLLRHLRGPQVRPVARRA